MKTLFSILALFVFTTKAIACSDKEAAMSTYNYLISYEDFQNPTWDLKFEYDEPMNMYDENGEYKHQTAVIFRAVDSYGDLRQGVMIWGKDKDYKCVFVSKSSLSFIDREGQKLKSKPEKSKIYDNSDNGCAMNTYNYLQSYKEFQNSSWDLKFEYDEPNILYDERRTTIVVFRAIDNQGDIRQGIMFWRHDEDYNGVLYMKSSLSYADDENRNRKLDKEFTDKLIKKQ